MKKSLIVMAVVVVAALVVGYFVANRGLELTEEDKIMAFLNTLIGEYQDKTLTNDNLQK